MSDYVPITKRLDVNMWAHGDRSFLEVDDKFHEDEWGRSVTRMYRPDLSLMGQWTNSFGEIIVKELLNANIPKKIGNCKLDLETDKFIIEVKTGTYNTTGTAHEKILGTPFKYADIPEKSGKPLLIVCLGGAEKYARSVGLFGSDSARKNAKLEQWKQDGIAFVPFTRLLNNNL